MTPDPEPAADPPTEAPERLASRRLTAEDEYYLEQAYKEPIESTARIEDTAKFLIGATATSSGLFAAACRLALGKDTVANIAWFLPFVFWALSILTLVFVLLPHRYEVARRSPADYRAAMLEARNRKWRRLVGGAVLFILGLCCAVIPFYS